MNHSNVYFTEDFGKKALERYWDTFIGDALFGNFDRHANNWGYLKKQSGEIVLAPIYDCGSCLYPQLADDVLLNILSDSNEIQMRIDKFPQAALELKDGKKASYKVFINSLANEDCNKALLRIFPKINMKTIRNIINNIPEISDIRKEFYYTMITARYEQILEPAYINLFTRKNDKNFGCEMVMGRDHVELDMEIDL